MQQTQQVDDVLVLANRVVNDESAVHRANGRAALVDRAWEYSNAANARLIADQNRAAYKSTGLGNLQTTIEALERAFTEEQATRIAFVKEYEACGIAL